MYARLGKLRRLTLWYSKSRRDSLRPSCCQKHNTSPARRKRKKVIRLKSMCLLRMAYTEQRLWIEQAMYARLGKL